MSVQSAATLPYKPTVPPFVSANLPTSFKDQWVAYCVDNIRSSDFLYIDVPKDMKPVKSNGSINASAADGGFSLLLKEPEGTLAISSSGPCVACSESAAVPYFASALKDLLTDYDIKNLSERTAQQLGENIFYPNKDLALFAYRDKNANIVHGFNQYTSIDYKNHPYGSDFSAQYTTRESTADLPWIFINLLAQNHGLNP